MNDGVYEWNYSYDPLNRLTGVQRDGNLSATYVDDAGGRRVRGWDTVDGTTDYVYCGLNIVDEVNSGVHERHVYAGSMHIASDTTGVVEYYHVDHLGSTRLKTNSSGGIIYESNYEPFGVSSGEDGSEDFRYTGKHEDTTGLYYFGARYYDPATGRFTTRDTVFGKLTDPQSQNRYVYCRNNPHKYVDPDGKEPLTAGLIIGAALLGGLVSMESYIWSTYCSGEMVNVNVMVGAFTGGAISGASGAVIGAAELTGFSGRVLNAVASATVEAISGIYEDYVSGEITTWDEIASDSAMGIITGEIRGPLEVSTFTGGVASSNKELIVDAVNTAGDKLIEHIREHYTIPLKGTPVYSYNERVDYWW